MLSIINLTWFHTKRMLKNIGFVGITFIAPLLFTIFFTTIASNDESGLNVDGLAVVNHSQWVEDEVIPRLAIDAENIAVGDDSAQTFDQLEQRELNVVYEIPEQFPEETVKIHSLNGDNESALFEAEFGQAIQEAVQASTFEEYGIDQTALEASVAAPEFNIQGESVDMTIYFMAMFLIMYMLMAVAATAADLVQMRQNQVLKRSITANASSWKILGSLLLGYTLANVIISLSAAVLAFLFLGIAWSQIIPIILLIFANAIFAAGLTMFLFRYIKESQIIAVMGTMIPVVLMVLAMAGSINENLEVLQYLTPFYWLMDFIDTGQMIPNLIIVVMYGLVLFTAGSFKVEKLVGARA